MDLSLAQRLVSLLRRSFDQYTIRSILPLDWPGEKNELKPQTHSGQMF